MTQTTDFLVIGGGVIGLSLALEARRRHPRSRVTLLEKEKACGLHASGRNSGVLHAGFYYTGDSFKARFTREGNRRLRSYCEERGLRINRCGKLVVARDAGDLAGLDELLRRAQRNGVELEELSAAEARQIEPRVKTFERALFSPSTATVDPVEVVGSLVRDAREAGIALLTDTAFVGAPNGRVVTSRGAVAAGYVINAAGLYADAVARAFGFSADYRILPFKGLYLYGDETERLRTNVYPVPDLANPFLGVHFTVGVRGTVKIGPTAVPAFWREHYRGWENFRLLECVGILRDEARLLLRSDFGFRRLALSEVQKYYRPRMVALASFLARDVRDAHYRRWGPAGIRAQLFDIRRRSLVMDFCFEGDSSSFHVLNAVSPAFTCALPFAEFVFDEIARHRG